MECRVLPGQKDLGIDFPLVSHSKFVYEIAYNESDRTTLIGRSDGENEAWPRLKGLRFIKKSVCYMGEGCRSWSQSNAWSHKLNPACLLAYKLTDFVMNLRLEAAGSSSCRVYVQYVIYCVYVGLCMQLFTCLHFDSIFWDRCKGAETWQIILKS